MNKKKIFFVLAIIFLLSIMVIIKEVDKNLLGFYEKVGDENHFLKNLDKFENIAFEFLQQKEIFSLSYNKKKKRLIRLNDFYFCFYSGKAEGKINSRVIVYDNIYDVYNYYNIKEKETDKFLKFLMEIKGNYWGVSKIPLGKGYFICFNNGYGAITSGVLFFPNSLDDKQVSNILREYSYSFKVHYITSTVSGNWYMYISKD